MLSLWRPSLLRLNTRVLSSPSTAWETPSSPANATSPTEAVAEPLRLPLELIEIILTHIIELLLYDDLSGESKVFGFCLRVGRICRDLNVWAEQRITRSLEGKSLAQIEDIVGRFKKYTINSAAKIKVLDITLEVAKGESAASPRQVQQEKALGDLLGFCTGVKTLRFFTNMSAPNPVVRFELFSTLSNLETLELNEVNLNISRKTSRFKLHLIVPFTRRRPLPSLSAPSIRCLRFYRTTYSEGLPPPTSDTIFLPSLFPSATLLTLTYYPFTLHTRCGSFPTLGFPSWTSLQALDIAYEDVSRQALLANFPPQTRFVRLGLRPRYRQWVSSFDLERSIEPLRRALEEDAPAFRKLEAVYIEMNENHALSDGIRGSSLKEWERFGRVALEKGVEVLLEKDDKVVEVGDDKRTTSVVVGKQSFAERLQEL